jgi:hypothetical protein
VEVQKLRVREFEALSVGERRPFEVQGVVDRLEGGELFSGSLRKL